MRMLGLVWILFLALAPFSAFATLDFKESCKALLLKPANAIETQVEKILENKGRAQVDRIEALLDSKKEEAKNKGQEWDAFVAEWECSVLERSSASKRKDKPSLDELLALILAKSPDEKQAIIKETLQKHGAARWSILSYYLRPVRIGNKVTHGRNMWDLWQSGMRIPLPKSGKAWTPEQFEMFMFEFSNALYRAQHSDPRYLKPLFKAFMAVRLNPKTWMIWRNFAEYIQKAYREPYKAYLEETSKEVFGEIRPEVIRQFYRFGMYDTASRRLAGLIKDKASEEIINKEAEKLALEVRFFVRPAIMGLFLFTMNMAYSAEQKGKQHVETVKISQDEIQEKQDQAEISAEKLEEQIEEKTDEYDRLQSLEKELSAELSKDPEGKDAQKTKESLQLTKKQIEKLKEEIGKLHEQKRKVKRDATDIHP